MCINDITILWYTLCVFILLSMQGILNRHLPDTNTLTITHSYVRIGGLVQFTAVKISIKRCLYILQWQESKPPWCTIARSAFFLIFKFAIPKIFGLFSIPGYMVSILMLEFWNIYKNFSLWNFITILKNHYLLFITMKEHWKFTG